MLKLIVSFLIFVFSLNSAELMNNSSYELPENTPEAIFYELSITPGDENGRNSDIKDYTNLQKVNGDVLNGGGQEEPVKYPITGKSEAYNTKSEKIIESVVKTAVEKSPVLIPVTPIPTPMPEPEPIIIAPVKPIDPPIIIPEPTIHPIKPPYDPCYCPPGQFCITIACLDVM